MQWRLEAWMALGRGVGIWSFELGIFIIILPVMEKLNLITKEV
jgi:hypothetical protein